MTRLPIPDRETMTPAQRAVHDKIASGPRGRSAAIFNLISISPDLCDVTQQVGAYLRYSSKLSERQREFAICISSARSRADYEWRAHRPLAVKAGVPEELLQAVGEGRRPDFTDDGDRIVHDYVTAALAKNGIPDATFEEARSALGDELLMDLTGLAGYYSMLATFMLAFDLMPDPVEPRAPWREGSAPS
jgi:4-carboxymuconolactone decarboxylase